MADGARLLPAVRVVAGVALIACAGLVYTGYREMTTPTGGDHLGICTVWDESQHTAWRVEDTICLGSRRDRLRRPHALRWWPATDARAVPALGSPVPDDGVGEPPSSGAHRIGAPDEGAATTSDAWRAGRPLPEPERILRG